MLCRLAELNKLKYDADRLKASKTVDRLAPQLRNVLIKDKKWNQRTESFQSFLHSLNVKQEIKKPSFTSSDLVVVGLFILQSFIAQAKMKNLTKMKFLVSSRFSISCKTISQSVGNRGLEKRTEKEREICATSVFNFLR